MILVLIVLIVLIRVVATGDLCGAAWIRLPA